MKLYANGVHKQKPITVKLNKSDVAGLISAIYKCNIRPEQVGGKERGRRK